MTPTEKQKAISEQAIYGDLRIQVGDSIRVANGTFTEYRGEYVRHVEFECKDTTGMLNINKIKPILRPLSDLTKEISHKGYNNNEPFIPLVELAKMTYDYLYNTLHSSGIVECGNIPNRVITHFGEDDICQQIHYDFLNMLHFDSRNLLDSNEAISTEIVNPYEVK